ncbi:uncharacterized protein LOC130895711 [Diorhabda carinulata]|uniref:uncharacterized protein LOC130895711 n=1 Tax=Diorhabda carinulata TaxID=1163345 RepID=UPI0025A17B71|nr:uncharacterized protein LOC130895711 [Diorhabda carinulata]
MEDIISYFGKLISNTIMVHIYSYPHFSIEILLAIMLCVCHILLFFEVNDIFHTTNIKAMMKLKSKHPHLTETADSDSFYSSSRVQVIPQRIETTMRKSYFVPTCRKVGRKRSTKSNLGWVIPRKVSSLLPHTFSDRVDYLLSITPSEYIRKYKERKNREAGLKSCIQSLSTLLESAVSGESNEMRKISRETLRKSINHIKETFESQILGDPKTKYLDIDQNSLHSLMSKAYNNKSIKATAHVVTFNVEEDEKEEKDEVDEKGDLERISEDTVDKMSVYSEYSDRSIEILPDDNQLLVNL